MFLPFEHPYLSSSFFSTLIFSSTLTSKGWCLVYLPSKKKGDKGDFEDKNFLITENQDNETVDIPVEENIKVISLVKLEMVKLEMGHVLHLQYEFQLMIKVHIMMILIVE